MTKRKGAVAPAKPVWPLQSQCDTFYGNPRGANGNVSQSWVAANLVHVVCPFPLHMGKTPIKLITIHKKCAESLSRVLNRTWDTLGHDISKISAARFDEFDGSFNWRNKRGGSTLSMHAYGAAIDWDAGENPFHASHFLFTKDSPLIAKFIEEGWIWGGGWSPGSQDAMHVQAARVHP
jgi:hypothetical protein